jgi:two-component system LytT family response regulator
MTLKALIIDDEPLAHDIVLAYAQSVPFIEIVGQCYLATEAIPVLNQQPIDLLFLDIQMPKIKGLDFLRTLKNPPIVIITSAYEEYALESFELDVCDYLHKPYRFDRFLKATNKALEWHQLKKQSAAPKPTDSPIKQTVPDHIFIKSDKKQVKVSLEDIYYLESYGNYVKVWLKASFLLTPATLSSFEESLPDASFMRIHKSFIINQRYIDYVEGNTVYLKNKIHLPIGKNYRQLVKRIFS